VDRSRVAPISVLSGCPDEELDAVARVASEREFAVLASGRRTASVVATSSVQVLAFFKPDVWGLERDAPEAARRLRAAMDEHLGSSPGSSSDE
jgi:hypothetical protein